LRTAAGHAAAAKELLEVIALSPNEMLRARLRRELSSKLGLDERTLLSAEAEAKATRARVKAQDERAQQAAQPAWKRGVPEPEHPLAHAERELLRFLFHQPAWLETALGDLDLNALSGKPEQRIGRALWMGLDAGRLPPAAPECNADVTSADIVARVVLDFLTRQEIGASNAVSEANEDYIPRAVEESEGGAEVEAARQVAITLASAPMKLEKAKPHEAYSSCLRPLAKLRLEMDLKAVKRAKAAALAANDPDGLAAAEEREQELQKTLLSMKRSA
jgi:DNA primase